MNKAVTFWQHVLHQAPVFRAGAFLSFGFVVIVESLISKDTWHPLLGYFTGSLLAVVGIADILAGYFRKHSFISERLGSGVLLLAAGVGILCVPNLLLNQFFPCVLLALGYIVGISCTVYGVLILVKEKTTFLLVRAILLLILAAAFFSIASAYVFYFVTGNFTISSLLSGLLGMCFVFSGIFLFVLIIQTEIQEKKDAEAISDASSAASRDKDNEVTIVNFSDLKRNTKVHNRMTEDSPDSKADKK